MTEQTTKPNALQLIAQAAEEGWEELDLSGMGLSQVPAEIGQCTDLKRLIFGKFDQGRVVSNPLIELPPEISDLSKLEVLNLRNTQISELPEHIAQLANLQSLDLSGTQISELPEHIAQLAN
ncbi:MAG: leucine-rich repeat domain-containing protein, partial [Cyanobacteria bacterium J06650_10]